MFSELLQNTQAFVFGVKGLTFNTSRRDPFIILQHLSIYLKV